MPKLMSIFPRTDIDTEAKALTLVNIILDLGIVAYDTETTGKDAHVAKPVLASMSVPSVPWKDQWGEKIFDLEQGSRFVFEKNPAIIEPLMAVLECEGVDVVAHNAKYDAHIVYREWGIVPGKGGRVFDTMVMDHVLDENRSGRHGLKNCCEDYGILSGMPTFKQLFKAPRKVEISDAEWALQYKREEFLNYAATDPYATLLLFYVLKDLLADQLWYETADGAKKTLWDFYLEKEEQFLCSTWIMERNGAYINPEALEGYRGPIKRRMAEIEAYYAQLSGEVIKLNSNPALQKLFQEKLGLPVVEYTTGGKSGLKKPSYNKSALSKLSKDYPDVVNPLLEYRKIGKLLSTYVEGLSKHIKDDNRIHCSFNLHIPVTGRLSSSGPNLQNIANPSDDERTQAYDIRKAFTAPEGHTLIVADFNQLEVVITAHISEDPTLINALREGRDLHAYTASMMFNLDYDKMIEAKEANENGVATSDQKSLLAYRKAAKTLLFGILYGMGEHSLGEDLKIPHEEARMYINRFFQTYPGILEAKKYWTHFCRNNGFVWTLMNRRRRLPEIYSGDYGVKARAERQLFNSVIQGTAADLMRDYLPAITNDAILADLYAKLVLQVHDEVVVEIPIENAELAKPRIETLMEASMSHIPWKVPLSVTAKIAKTWSEGK